MGWVGEGGRKWTAATYAAKRHCTGHAYCFNFPTITDWAAYSGLIHNHATGTLPNLLETTVFATGIPRVCPRQ